MKHSIIVYMKMARPRKPDALKLTHQPSRTNFKQPKPPKDYPRMPPGLSPDAQLSWQSICDTLYELGVLTAHDALAVEGICEAYAELRQARKAIRELGSLTYKCINQKGDVMHRAYPEVAIANDADRRFRMWLSALGLTPSDRSRVTTIDRPDDNEDLSEFIQ